MGFYSDILKMQSVMAALFLLLCDIINYVKFKYFWVIDKF